MGKNYEVLNELVPKTQELHRAIFDEGYEQGQRELLYEIRSEINCVEMPEENQMTAIYYLQELKKSQTGKYAKKWLDEAIEALEKKQKTGHWIGDTCSECGEERAWYGSNPPYCPDCGVKMVGSQESEDEE